MLKPSRLVLTPILVLAAAGTASTAQVIDVDFDEILTEFDLRFMTFNGTPFTLAPGTVFNINDGGTLTRVGFLLEQQPYSFGGSTLNINNGGVMEGGSSISNVEMNLFEGGLVRDGLVNDGLSLYENATLNVTGGRITGAVSAFEGSTINVHGGVIGSTSPGGTSATLSSGSEFSMTGGLLMGEFIAGDGSVANFTGGRLSGVMSAQNGSNLTISGGEFLGALNSESGSSVTISGGSYGLNGSSVTQISGGVAQGDVFSGVLADGRVFITDGFQAAAGTTTLNAAPLDPVDTTPQVLNSGVATLGLRDGQTLTLSGTSSTSNGFAAIGSDLIVDGGNAGEDLRTLNSSVTLNSGSIGDGYRAFTGSTVVLNDGTIGNDTRVEGNSQVFINGGVVRSRFRLSGSSTLVMDGGQIGEQSRIENGASLTLHNGTIGDQALATHGGHIELNGGSIGDLLALTNMSTLTMNAGHIGNDARVEGGSTLEINDGIIGDTLMVSDSHLIVNGGSIGTDSIAGAGSTVGIFGGSIGDGFTAGASSMVNIHGGALGLGFTAEAGSQLSLFGAGFEIDGASVSDLAGGFSAQGIFSGVLADGTVLIMDAGSDGTNIASGTTTLNTVALGPVDTTPMTLSSGTASRKGLRGGQSLTLTGNAHTSGVFGMIGADLTIDGVDAVVDSRLRTIASSVTLDRGTIGDQFVALRNSAVEVNGGAVGNNFRLDSGSSLVLNGGTIGGGFILTGGSHTTVNGGALLGQSYLEGASTMDISGGSISRLDVEDATLNITGGDSEWLRLYDGAVANISGGTNSSILRANAGASLNISGGNLEGTLDARSGSTVILSGGIFLLDGAVVSSLNGTVGANTYDTFTGILADGSIFFFEEQQERLGLTAGTTSLDIVDLPEVDLTPIVVDSGPAPVSSIRSGQTLSLLNGGSINERFLSIDANLDIQGGTVSERIIAAVSDTTITGGSIAAPMRVLGGTVSIQGGSVSGIRASAGASLDIQGGSIGDINLAVGSGSHAEISGGQLNNIEAGNGSSVRWSGGKVIGGVGLSGTMNTIVGNGFQVNGVAETAEFTLRLNQPSPNEAYFDFFSGVLADGTVIIKGGNDFGGNALGGSGTFELVELDPVNTTPQIANSGVLTKGLWGGQDLTALSGATLGAEFGVLDSTLTLDGADTDGPVRAFRSTVNVNTGSVGTLAVYSGSDISIDGGAIDTLIARDLTEVGELVTVDMNAGAINSLELRGRGDAGVEFNYTGGTVSHLFTQGNATLNILDGDFAFNSPESLNLRGATVGVNGGRFAGSISGSGTLAVNSGVFEGSASLGTSINVTGGTVIGDLTVVDGDLNISGGEIQGRVFARVAGFDSSFSSIVNISGGTFSGAVDLTDGELFSISGGQFNDQFRVNFSNDTRISGGEFNDTVILEGNIEVSGGEFNGTVALLGADVDFLVQQYWIDGVAFMLELGETGSIDARGGELFEAILADGTFFDMNLNDGFNAGEDSILGSDIRVIGTVPTPGSLAALALCGLFASPRKRRAQRA